MLKIFEITYFLFTFQVLKWPQQSELNLNRSFFGKKHISILKINLREVSFLLTYKKFTFFRWMPKLPSRRKCSFIKKCKIITHFESKVNRLNPRQRNLFKQQRWLCRKILYHRSFIQNRNQTEITSSLNIT